jgi:BRCA1-associated protein
MDISTQHVWDYAGDGYVHRLIQSKPDFVSPPVPGGAKDKHAHSGLIDLGSSKTRHENEAYRAEAEDMVPREKMETMANEYTYLLTSQLEGQRRYFEEQVERAVDKASAAAAQAESASTHAEKATSALETMQIRYASLESSMAGLEKSLDKSEQRREKFEKMARELTGKLKEEQTINAGLMERIKAAEAKSEEARKEAEAARAEKAELEEMNRDLTMFISGQEKIKELEAQGEEVVDGTLSLPEQQQKGGKKGKGRKR